MDTVPGARWRRRPWRGREEAEVTRHARGNVLYVRFTPRPPPERRWSVMAAVAVLALATILLTVVLYLVLAPNVAPRVTLRACYQALPTGWYGEGLESGRSGPGRRSGVQ